MIVMSHSPGTSLEAVTIGRYLAASLADLGVTHVFALPGDSIIPLLVEFLAEKRIEMVWCTNELNTGYACGACVSVSVF